MKSFSNNGPPSFTRKIKPSYCSDHAHTVGCHIKQLTRLSKTVSCGTLWKAQIKTELHHPIKDACSTLQGIYTPNLLFTILGFWCPIFIIYCLPKEMLLSSEAIRNFFQLVSLQSLQGASIWSQSQTKHHAIHTAAPENKFADRTVSSVRCVQSIIDQLMPYNVLPSVINGIHKH